MTGHLKRLLDPGSIAYIGGAQIAGPIRASLRAGYDGEIRVINPVRDEIDGIACAPSIADLPSPPDAAVVALSPERAIATVEELSRAGAGGAVVMSSGFAEIGTDVGRDRQERLKIAAGAMPLLGPNCMGLINQFSGAAVWGDDNHIERQTGPAAAIISQSGALLIGMTNVEEAFPLGYAVSVGNQSGTSVSELIDAVLADERINAIGLYIEGLDDGEAFGQACLRAVDKGVPVVALKGGDGEQGSRVSLSHTASMVMERDIWQAFCTRFAIVEVFSPKALVESLKLLTIGGLPKGNRVSIVSYSGGLNGLAAAAAAKNGLELPMPTPANAEMLAQTMPETVTLNNPLDLNIPFRASDGSISMQNTAGVADALVAFGENVSDQMAFFIDVPRPGVAGLDKVWCDSLEALTTVRRKLGIPISVAGILPEGLSPDFRKHMQANGVAALQGYADTMEALTVSAGVASAQDRLKSQRKSKPLLHGAIPTCPRMLDEAESKYALSGFGLETPVNRAVSIADAPAAAAEIGFPVAVKVLSSTIAHKAQVGGVALDLQDTNAVEVACRRMARTVSQAESGHEVTNVIVEGMVTGADAELIVGVKRHPAIGLALMVGRGGTRTEEMARFETTLLPLTDGALDAIFARLGVNGHPAANELRKACQAVAAYAISQSERLMSLDVNPVMLTSDGRALAADALIVLGE